MSAYDSLRLRVSDVYAGSGGDFERFVNGLSRALHLGFMLMNVPKPLNRDETYLVDTMTRYLFDNNIRAEFVHARSWC
jgi:hypothetical protein